MANETAIVPLENFVLATVSPENLGQLIMENLGGSQIDPMNDLDRVKIPTGGMTKWAIPGLEGDEFANDITGVIIHWQNARGYWPGEYAGGNEPPQCASDDGKFGNGIPGGPCYSCPKAQWNSAEKAGSKGQACKATMRVFVLQPGSLLPLVIALPPTSIKPARQYMARLLNKQTSPFRVMTKFTLEKASSGTGIAYAKVSLSYVGPLSSEDQALVESYKQTLTPLLSSRGMSAGDLDSMGE